MKKLITCLLATLGLTSSCAQQNFENTNVENFAKLIAEPDVVLLDVRSADEFREGHIAGALHIDQNQSDFMEKAKASLPREKRIAVYCRSGRRSASAAGRLAAEGYRCINLTGGIMAWQTANRPVTTNTYEVDEFRTKNGKTVRFHTLMHASIRIEFDGMEFHVDPVTKLRDRTIDYTQMPKADYILVTHEHGDHYDEAALSLLTSTDTHLIMNKRTAEMHSGTPQPPLGGEMVNLHPMVNGQSLMFNEIRVDAVPAYNTTEGHLQFHPKGRDNGYILTLDGLRIYFAGDTEDIPEMADLGDIDIAFLPCNQPYTMTPEQLVRAAKLIRPRVLFPYHYGQTDVSGIPALLKDESIDVRIRHYE